MGYATRFVDSVKTSLSEIAQHDLVFNEEDKCRARVAKVLREQKGQAIAHGTALRRSHLSASKFKQVIQTLDEAGELRVGTAGKGKCYTWIGN